jgi:hypothetical protein
MLNCPAKNETYSGNCEYCTEKTDCMIRDVIQKLQDLTKTVNQMKASPVK